MLTPPTSLPTIPRRPLIIHNDLDGILSYLFMRELGYELSGIYDLQTLWMTPGTAPRDTLAVDLDITHPDIPSIGHHFVSFVPEGAINMNHLFGVRDVSQFFSKCPLPTFLFLHWLTGTPLPVSKKRRAWLVYTDAMVHYWTKYQKNVAAWLTALGYTDLLAELKDGSLLPYVDEIAGICRPYSNTDASNQWPQVKFAPGKLQELLPFLQEAAYHLGYQPIFDLPTLHTLFTASRYRFSYDDQTHEILKARFATGDILGHALIARDKVNVTLVTPLSQERDKGLIAKLSHPIPRNTEIIPAREETPECPRKTTSGSKSSGKTNKRTSPASSRAV